MTGGATGWDGDRYDRINALQRWVAGRSLDAIELSGGERLLDIGCGDGRITADLADRLTTGSAVGIDPSPSMIAVARTRSADRRNLAFLLGTAQHLPVAGPFEVVVSFNALHWVADQAGALGHIRRVLADDGSALLQMVCAGGPTSLEQTAMVVSNRLRWQDFFADFTPPFHHPDPAAFVGLADAVGLASVHLAVDQLRWKFQDRAEFAGWCSVGFADWLARLPDEASRGVFVDEVCSAYAELVGSDHLLAFLQMTARFRAC